MKRVTYRDKELLVGVIILSNNRFSNLIILKKILTFLLSGKQDLGLLTQHVEE